MNIQFRVSVFFACKALTIGALFLMLSAHTEPQTSLPEFTGVFTASNALVSQTDSTPTITASNQKVRDGIVANNCLPFGTKIRVNNRVLEIQDRMNRRYGCQNFDIYMNDYSDAVDFGRQTLKYEVI